MDRIEFWLELGISYVPPGNIRSVPCQNSTHIFPHPYRVTQIFKLFKFSKSTQSELFIITVYKMILSSWENSNLFNHHSKENLWIEISGLYNIVI